LGCIFLFAGFFVIGNQKFKNFKKEVGVLQLPFKKRRCVSCVCVCERNKISTKDLILVVFAKHGKNLQIEGEKRSANKSTEMQKRKTMEERKRKKDDGGSVSNSPADARLNDERGKKKTKV
jgi:hypothetical protein